MVGEVRDSPPSVPIPPEEDGVAFAWRGLVLLGMVYRSRQRVALFCAPTAAQDMRFRQQRRKNNALPGWGLGLPPKTWSSLNGNRTTGREPGSDPCENDPDRTRSPRSSARSRPTSTPA